MFVWIAINDWIVIWFKSLLDFTGESGLNEFMIANYNKLGLRARNVQSDGYTDEDYDYCDTDDSDYAYWLMISRLSRSVTGYNHMRPLKA